MDIFLFLLGALGALLTVYLAKQEVIPEFRPLFDTIEKEKEAKRHRDHIIKTEQTIDEIQEELRTKTSADGLAQNLQSVLQTSQKELDSERARLQTLEHEIKQNQIISRSLGFLFYIALGGVFGSILAEKVQVEGLSGDFPDYFKSIVIGATWTTYLSVFGSKFGQKRVDETLEAAPKQLADRLNTAKTDIVKQVVEEVTKAETSEKVEEPVYADMLARAVSEKFDNAVAGVQEDMSITRQQIQRDIKGIL